MRRFPQLGFERQSKSNLGIAFRSVLYAQGALAHQAVGGLRALGDLGVVNPEQVGQSLDDALAGNGPERWVRSIWDILNLEVWARARHF